MTDAEKIDKIRAEAEARAKKPVALFTRSELHFVATALRHVDLKEMQQRNVNELRHADQYIVSTHDIGAVCRILAGKAEAEAEDPQAEHHPTLREIIDATLGREPRKAAPDPVTDIPANPIVQQKQ